MSIKLLDTIYKLTDNADKLDGKHASDFATSGHTHSSLSTVGDKRAEATTPNSYSNKFIFQGLKTNSSFGSPSTDTYSYILGLRGWSDSSGGNSWELAFNNSGIYSRNGASTSWGSWYRLLDSSNSSVSKSGQTLTVKINGTSQSLSNTTYSAGTGLSLSGTTFNHASSVTAGTAGTSSATSGSTLAVPYVTYNATGHITATGTHTHTITGFASSSHNHDGVYLKLSGGTLTGNFAANNNTKTPFNLTTNLYYVNKALNWGGSSYIRNVILLIPVQTSTNWSGYNYIDGKFLLWKSGGNMYDVVEVNLNNVYNSLEYRLLASGQHSSLYKLCICKYNGVSYYAIDCPYHANPYNNAEFYGHIRSSLTGGTGTVNLPLTVDYYNENTQTVLNSEVKNSITSTLTTSVVTSVSSRNLFSIAGFSGSLSGNASTATKLQTARTISLTGSVTGSGSFDGSGNLSIATTTNHTHSYLPLSGGTLSGSGSGLLTINRTSGNPLIQFTANGTLVGFLGVNTSGAPIFVNKDTTSYNLLHSGNSSVSKSGETLTVKINGTTQSLTNTNTWRGITDSYSGTATDTSLSQKGGKALYDALVNGYASSAGNADTLDNYHASSFGIWRGNVQTDPEADDTTYTTTADFLKQIHARTSIFNSNFSAFRGSWYYVGNVNYNTGVGSLEMAGTAVLNISGNCTNDVNYKSLIFLDRTGELFSYVSQESGVAKWSRYLKSSEVGNGTITIKQAGTSKGSFTVNQSGNTTIELTDSNTNTTYSAGTGISLSGTTFSNSGVRSVATGTSNGTISVNTNGTTANVAVKGLGSAAYTASTAYAASSHTHTKSQITDFSHTHDYAASSHSHGALAGGWYTTFTVNGDANTYYPVVLNSVSSKYPMQLVNISRGYAETAPNSWNTSTHRGGLTLTLLWNGSRYWDGNGSGSPCHCVYKYESYCTMVGGLGNSTAGIVVWLRGGGAVYYLHSMNGGSATATVHLSTYTDSASQSFAPKTSVSSFSVGWPYALNADKVDNKDSSAFAAASHNHDSAYAAKSHTHSYAASSHNHDSAYAAKSHTHNYAASSHNHDSVYSKLGHTHSYAASSHTHNYAGSSSAGGAATSANKLNTNAGSATKPVYFSGGVPVQVTGCMIQYWAIYEVYFSPSGTSGSTITKKAGNHNFCSSISSREALGQIIVNTSYPSGFNESTTMIFGVGDHAESNHTDSVYITVNKQYGSGTQMRLILADDDRQNWGYAHLYFLCIS